MIRTSRSLAVRVVFFAGILFPYLASAGQREIADPAISSQNQTPPQSWPGFRGGDCGPLRDLPLRWSPTANIAWKAALPGYGQSCPVVWGSNVFVTAVDGPQRDKGFVLALDAVSGKERWRHAFEPSLKVKWTGTISRAAPTPVVDAAAVYSFFEGGDLVALSHAGKLLWSRSLVKEFGEFQNGHGLGSSPAQTADAVIVLIDHKGPSYLLAVDKTTGKTLWKTDRPSRSSWTSPVVATRDGKQEIVVSSNGSVASYDARTGKLLWELDGVSGNTIPSATVADGLVVVGAGPGKGASEGAKVVHSSCCLKLTGKGGQRGYEVVWSAKKAAASFASPLIHKGSVYFVSEAGVVHCLSLATGEVHYAERLDGPCWATPIGAGDHLWFFGKDGQTAVLKAGPKFDRVATNTLWDAGGPAETLYGVAAIDGAFFLRSETTLYRIGSRDGR